MSEQRVGAVLRQWRKHRRMSQIDLSESAEVSTRHLSCIETGKTRASPEMLLVLASALEMPLKERNQLLLAGGYAPAYQDPTVASPQVERAVDVILQGAEPYPAIALDLNWDLRNANGAAARLFGALSPSIAARALAGERVNLMLALVEDPELREKVLNWTDV
ncbi:MAG: helix-turn-helix domain-containing protein, partial [Myxococcota bacterium]